MSVNLRVQRPHIQELLNLRCKNINLKAPYFIPPHVDKYPTWNLNKWNPTSVYSGFFLFVF